MFFCIKTANTQVNDLILDRKIKRSLFGGYFIVQNNPRKSSSNSNKSAAPDDTCVTSENGPLVLDTKKAQRIRDEKAHKVIGRKQTNCNNSI